MNTTPRTQTFRELGLTAADENRWTEAMVYLNKALRNGQMDVTVLDAFGEAAYRTNTPEALGPYQNHYKYPALASHMARAFLMLGDVPSSKEFLGYAKDSALKSALFAMLELGSDIKATVATFLPIAEAHPNLYYPEYWRALSAVADAAGREDLTVLSERRSKAFAYKDPNIHFNQALRMLGKGEFRAGWRLYDWRLVPNANQSNRTELGGLPMWEGENLAGKKLLIYLEQGLGDGIFSLRYFRLLQQQGATLEVVSRPPLLKLIKASFPEIKVHNEDEAVVVGYWDDVLAQSTEPPDFWVYGLSIPHRAGLWKPTGTAAFAKAPAANVEKVRQQLQTLNPKGLPVCCINWHGRIDTEADRSRAFSVQEFAEIAGINKKSFCVISVQKERTPDEIQWLQQEIAKAGGVFFDASPELSDFVDTAAWILNSRELITCDTSVSHLGGALGHPTRVLARNKAIWQWLRKDFAQAVSSNGPVASVWYDSVTVEYALTPEISYLFSTPIIAKDSKDDPTAELVKNAELPSPKPGADRQRKPFRFAGRP